MKRGKCLLFAVAVVVHIPFEMSPTRVSAAPAPSSLIVPQARNSITGNVFGESRRPVADAHVELLDEYGMMIGRTRTNGVGRYVFYGLAIGRYKIRVMPYTSNYLEQTQEVSLIPVSASPGSGSASEQVDFNLRAKVGGAGAGPFFMPGTVFVQEVPEAAKKLFEKGIGELGEKKEKEGFDSLRRSLEIFPTYYDALNRLGTEYASRGKQDKSYFEAAHVILSKSVEVNPRSASSLFGLGFSQYHLGLIDQSITNLQRAVNNYNKEPNCYLWLGIAFKRAGKLEQAETSLKRADELIKGRSADVHWHLAQVYSDQKRYAEAASALEMFLKNQSDARDAEKIKQMIAKLKEKASKS